MAEETGDQIEEVEDFNGIRTGEDDVVVDDTAPPTEREKQFAATLTQQQKQIHKTEALAELLADPDLAAIYAAKQRGQKFKVVTGPDVDPARPNQQSNQQQPQEVQEPEDWEALDNKTLARHIQKQTQSALEKTVMKAVQPLIDKMNQVDQFVANQETNQITSQISQMRTENKDFDLYASEMMKLTDAHPTLGPKELYLLAKAQKAGVPDASQRRLETERPSHTSARPSAARRKAPLPPGRAGLRQALSEAASRVDMDSIMSGGEDDSDE